MHLLKCKKAYTVSSILLMSTSISSCTTSFGILEGNKAEIEAVKVSSQNPADKFDLSHWSITLPVDDDENGKVDVVNEVDIQSFHHSDYFYIDEDGFMVFMSPNKASTTPNSTNARSELRYESRGGALSVKGSDPKNNFALAANENASDYAAVGGKLEATLKVDHVSRNAGYPDKEPAYSVVIGQIHAGKLETKVDGFGWGNEPLKISFKKRPDHEYGSVYWTYERNLALDNPDRIDIEYLVWGKSWVDLAAPEQEGIKLGEEFSYTVNVHENTMYLTFENERLGTKTFEINLSNNVDANGEIDPLDHPNGYTGDYLYFKAGAYNQCSTKDAPSFRYPACPGTGNLEQDIIDGNYAQVSFRKLSVSEATPN